MDGEWTAPTLLSSIRILVAASSSPARAAGLVTWGETLDEARDMARDAMEGYIEVLIEDGEAVPESDSPEMAPRYDRLAQTLRDDAPFPVSISPAGYPPWHDAAAEPETPAGHRGTGESWIF